MRGSTERRLAATFVALHLFVGAAAVDDARASPPDSSTAADKRLVAVKIAGASTRENAPLLRVVRERVTAPDITASIELVPAIDRASVVTARAKATTPETEAAALARVWIDVPSDRENITIYVVDGTWEHVLVRSVSRAHETNAEVTWEEIGHILDLALIALREGNSIGVERAVAEKELLGSPAEPIAATTTVTTTVLPMPSTTRAPAEVATPPPMVRERTWTLAGGGFYGVTAYGSGELSSGPGLIGELHHAGVFSPKLELGAIVTAEYHFPSTVDRGNAIVRFEGAAAYLLASSSCKLGSSDRHHHRLMLAAGPGIELVQAHAESSELATLRFTDRDLQPIASARVLARYGFDASSSLRLFAGVGMDLPFTTPRYLLTRSDAAREPIVLFEPWAIRPFLVIGLEAK